MAAADALSGVQFHHFNEPMPTVEAWSPEHAGTDWAKAGPAKRNPYHGSSLDPGHRPLGSLSWHADTGEIQGVYVVPERQRQGLATTMLSQARSIDPQVRHSTHLSNSGRAWSVARP